APAGRGRGPAGQGGAPAGQGRAPAGRMRRVLGQRGGEGGRAGEEEVLLGGVARGPRGDGVLGGGLLRPSQSAQEVGAHGVEGVVARERQRVDRLQGGGGTVDLGQRNRPVQRHHRRGLEGEECVIGRQDAAPVGVRGGRSGAVD